jgi:hypothetical protein
MPVSTVYTFDELIYCLRLISGKLEIGYNF